MALLVWDGLKEREDGKQTILLLSSPVSIEIKTGNGQDSKRQESKEPASRTKRDSRGWDGVVGDSISIAGKPEAQYWSRLSLEQCSGPSTLKRVGYFIH